MIVVGATSGCQGCRTGRQIIIATESTHTGGGEICQRATDERCCLVTSRLALQQTYLNYSLNMIDDTIYDEIDDDSFKTVHFFILGCVSQRLSEFFQIAKFWRE